MKKEIIFMLAACVLLAGCSLDTNKSGAVEIRVEERSYVVSDSNPFVDITHTISNGLAQNAYYEDPQCGQPFKVLQLKDNIWKERTDLSSGCFALAQGTDKPKVLRAGKSSAENKTTIEGAGEYKIEFTYFLSKDDYAQRVNPQHARSQSFGVAQTITSVRNTVDSCSNSDARENRVAECLYVAAKRIAPKDVNVAIDLCKEAKEIYPAFDECYYGVALILAREGDNDKVLKLCQYYSAPDKIQACIDKVARFK